MVYSNKHSYRVRTINPAPPNYTPPPFPSLYSPIHGGSGVYLYYSSDVWRFTLFWTLIVFQAFHLAASGYAVVVQWKNWKLMWLVPIFYLLVGGVEAVLAGSIVGLMYVIYITVVISLIPLARLGAAYDAGDFRMSTWIPLIWALINVLVLILSSFSIQGGL